MGRQKIQVNKYTLGYDWQQDNVCSFHMLLDKDQYIFDLSMLDLIGSLN